MFNLRYWSVFAATAVIALAQSPMKMTADQVISFVKSSIQLKHDDRKVADYVHKIKLTDKLEERRVEELQGQGAGPRTIAALHELSTASASLTVAPPPEAAAPRAVIPPPSSIEQARILDEIVEHARNYAQGLPNYMCIQVTRRHRDLSGGDDWRPVDTIQEQLSYVDHRESYKVVNYNGQAVANMEHNQLPGGGAISSGEFGTLFTEIFSPQSDTRFDWDHWATLRGKRMYVYSYKVEQARSHYTIFEGLTNRTVTSGYHGLIYADRDSKMVMRWTLDCDTIPADFPVKDVKLDVNYDNVDIAGKSYILPLKTEVKSLAQGPRGRQASWNEAEFHLYRRFSTESSITFDTPDPIPDDQTKEQPAVPDSAVPNSKDSTAPKSKK